MTRPFRLAVVGIDHPHGFAWRETLRNFGDEITTVAVVPAFEGSMASLEEVLADCPRWSSVAALLASALEFDGALVCLSNDEAPDAIRRLAASGKHILAEKPIAGSADAVREAIDSVDSSEVAFQTGYVWRFDPGANRIRSMIADGRFGSLISIEMSLVTSDMRRRGAEHYLFDRSRSGGGFFNWLACHWIDLLMYVAERPIIGVTARTGVFGATVSEVEDGGVAIFDLEGGGIATFLGGYWMPRWAGESRWTLRGTERWVHWDPSRAGTGGVLEIHGPKPQWDAMDEVFTIPPDVTPGYAGRRGVDAVREWLDAARGRTQACRNTTRSTLAVLEALDAIDLSSREGRRVECRIQPT